MSRRVGVERRTAKWKSETSIKYNTRTNPYLDDLRHLLCALGPDHSLGPLRRGVAAELFAVDLRESNEICVCGWVFVRVRTCVRMCVCVCVRARSAKAPRSTRDHAVEAACSEEWELTIDRRHTIAVPSVQGGGGGGV